MEHSELHQEKIQILSRLIKESSLTLEEALLLLQEEEEIAPVSIPSYIQGTGTPWSNPYYGSGTVPLTGTITVSNAHGGIGLHNTTTTATYPNLNTPQTLTADLNT
jgi:hypothetical protein